MPQSVAELQRHHPRHAVGNNSHRGCPCGSARLEATGCRFDEHRARTSLDKRVGRQGLRIEAVHSSSKTRVSRESGDGW